MINYEKWTYISSNVLGFSFRWKRQFIYVKSLNPKYNAYYVENIVKTKWLDKLNKMEHDILQKGV